MLVTSIYTKEVQAQHDYSIKRLNDLKIPHKFIKKSYSGFEGDGSFRTPIFDEACYHKQLFALKTIKKHNTGDLLIFSDVDVIALQHYNKLISYVDNYDICFMAENADMKKVNCGFVLVKCTSKSIDFYEKWHELCKRMRDNGKRYDDQPVLNRFLFKNNNSESLHYRKMLNYFPHNIVAKSPATITPDTVALHAIGCTGNEIKIKRMEAALSKFNEYGR